MPRSPSTKLRALNWVVPALIGALGLSGCARPDPAALFPLTLADGIVTMGTLGLVNPGLERTAKSVAAGDPVIGLEVGERRNFEVAVQYWGVLAAVAAALSGVPAAASSRSLGRF